jgi:hypothetical protein
LNICLRRLCETNDAILATDYFSHRMHALSLIERDAHLYAMYDYNSTYPLLLAVQTGDRTIVEKMLVKNRDHIRLDVIEPLIYACTRSNYQIVQILVDFGFNPNTIMIDRESHTMKNRKIQSVRFICFDSYYSSFS